MQDLLARGNALAGASQWQEAAQCYRAVLAHQPNHAAAQMNLGNVLEQVGEISQAIACKQAACNLAPASAMAWGSLAVTLMRASQHMPAGAAFDRALALNPDDPALRYNAGLLLQASGHHAAACAQFTAALSQSPGFTPARAALGTALLALGQALEAASHLQAATQAECERAEYHLALGNALREAGDLHGAIAAHRIAAALQPDLAGVHINLGNEYQELGRMADASACFRRACQLEPGNPAHWLALANTGTLRPGDPALRTLRRLAATPNTSAAPTELHFALARVLHDAGDAARAFSAMRAGNQRHRASITYDEQAELRQLLAIASAYPCQNAPATLAPGLPVLVVGMPRAGTTLIEQILASHPAIHGAGECTALPRLAAPLSQHPPPAATRARIAASYTGFLRAQNPEAARVVDKLPDNLRWLGLAHACLPAARFILVRRDPFATCMSCYAKLFGGHLPYAYDLGELGRYWRAQNALALYWRATLPQSVLLEVELEELLAEPRPQIERMLAHIGLDWHPACAAPERTQRPVRSASLYQVRKALGEGGTDWEKYRQYAGELVDAIGR